MDLPDIVSVDESNFDFQVLAYSEQMPVLVLFWAQWCLTCRATTPLLETFTEDHPGKIRLAKVDVDTNPQLIKRYQVHSVPTLKTFQNSVVIHEKEGIRNDLQVIDYVKNIVPGPENLLVEKASNLLKTKQFGAVEETCLEILEDLPDHSLACLLLANALIWQGEYLEALTILSHFPASPEYLRAELLKPLVEQLLSINTRLESSAKDQLDLIYDRALNLIELGNFPASLDGLIGIIQKDKGYRDGKPRLVALGIFELLGKDHQITREYRPLLANSLF